MSHSSNAPDNHASSDMEDELPPLQQHPNMLKTRDLLLFSGEDAGHTSTPPPRVAARFRRPQTNRRRSSATSSRRNSLSSSHSHHSNRALRNLHHNHQIAQHLRRASIIEDRKARLADRAAHVEQVRLRAALAKATPRCSNIEEKTLAAHQARERHLAKVAAQCAEEVSKARRVAEEMKEKKAAEEQRFMQEMADKQAEAERRRLEVKRSPRKVRSASLYLPEAKKEEINKQLSVEVACIRIQKMWRRIKNSKSASNFAGLEFSINRIRDSSFSDATDVLGDERLISTTKEVMDILHLEGESPCSIPAVRRFLSAYMILGHPTDVFTKSGQQEQDLMDKAKEMLIHFQGVLPGIKSKSFQKTPSTLLEGLSQAYSAYVIAFASWQSRDATVLIETMIDQFVAFDAIWQTVKDDSRGEVAIDYREGIREQQVLLLSKIKKLAGAERASTLIKKAIRESRSIRTRQLTTGDTRPRQIQDLESDVKVISPVPEDSTTIVARGGSIDESPEHNSDSYGLSQMYHLFSVVPDNRIVVHELLVDPSYRVEEVSAGADVRSALNRMLCDGMQQAFLTGQEGLWTVAIADNVRAKLLRLLKPENGMYHLISEALDPDHVRTQCQQGLFSYGKFFAFMGDLLPRLCAPFRDEEVRRVTQSFGNSEDNLENMITKLFWVLRVVDLMSLDYVNFMIQQAAPTLIQEGRGYEQRMFAQEIENGTITLQKTRSWLSSASVNLVTESGYNESRSPAVFERVYARGLVDLAFGGSSFVISDVPETLHLDMQRLGRIRLDTKRLITVGAILLTAKNMLKRDVRTQWKTDAKRIFDSIKDNANIDLSAKILATIESSHPMPQSSREQLSNFITRFLADSRRDRLGDPVMKLLSQRLRLHIFNRLAASSSLERVRMASTASEGLAAIGLSEFIGQIGQIADELCKVASIDRDAHSFWYRQIMHDMESS